MVTPSTTVSHLSPLSGFPSTTQLQCKEEDTVKRRSSTQLPGGLLVNPPHLYTPAGCHALFASVAPAGSSNLLVLNM